MSAALAGRRFVVTGGASGIGLAAAKMAAGRGARVFLLDRDADGLRRAGAEGLPGAACDVADADSVQGAVAQAVAELGGIDALVNSAGIDLLAPLDATADTDWARVLAVNLTGPMQVCRAALPELRRAGQGSIVNVASGAGLMPLQHRTAYCASKAGLIMFGKSLALEVAGDGVRVNAVCPGAIDTPLFRTSYEGSADPQAELEKIRARYALRRTAVPDEVAEAIVFLSSPAASYITGAALAVDGGRTFH